VSRPDAPDLARTERLLSELIRAPAGVQATLGRPGSASLAEQLQRTVAGDETRPPQGRLEVYANAYFYRILDCLKDDYAALAAVLGEDYFHDTVVAYLLGCPSRHPSIRYVGDRMAQFVAEDERLAPVRERFPFAADLARLEWALQDAFDAPDAVAMTVEDVARLAPEDWAGLPLRPDASVQLLELAWPMASLRKAFEREETMPEPSAVKSDPETVLVFRRSESVSYRLVDTDEADALRAVLHGTQFGRVCEIAALHVGEDEAPGTAARWLARWLADQCIRKS
jgi:hypothetical protein